MDTESERTPDSTTPPDNPTRPASIYFTTFLGLAVGFSVLLKPLSQLLNSLLQWAGISQYGCWSLINVAYQLIATVVILGIVVALERKPLLSVGLRRPTLSDVGLGLALFVAVWIAGGVFRLLLLVLFPNSMLNVANCQLNSFMRVPAGLGVIVAAAAGISEEVAARGFAIDRIRIVTGRLALAAAVALALDLAEHIPYWGWRYAIMIAPMQLLFVLMYLWRKDIMACIIGHFLVDAMPFLTPMAMVGVVSLFGYGGVHETFAQRYYSLGDNAGAIAEYTRALQSKPNDPDLLKARASVETSNRDYVAAIGDLDNVLSHDPKEPDPAALIGRAMAYYYTGYYDKAQADADQAVALSQKDTELYSYRAYIDEERGQYDNAISDLGQAIKYSKRKNEDLYYRRGYDYQEKADYDHAIEDYSEAAKLDPSDVRIFRQRAEALTHKKRPDLAASDLAQIKASSKEDFVARATIHEDAGEYRLALDDYNRAVAVAPNDWESANATAWLLSTCPAAKVRDGNRALTMAKKACDLSSWQNAYVIDTLAASLAETGDFTQAVTWQERSIDLMKSQSGPADVLQQARNRLDLYRKGQPYREQSPKK
jgi:tetratricopeptide (TPR) repeat protein/membrane protease YdiL (CAAX protease family)